MASMSSMHEHMKQRACEEYSQREPAEEMGAVLRNQIEGRDCQKPDESDLERRGSALLILGVGVVCTVFHEVASAGGHQW